MYRSKHPVAFLTTYARQEDELRIPEDPAELSDEDLDSTQADAIEAFNALYNDGDVSEDDMDQLGALAEGIKSLRAEKAKRDEAKAERSERAAEIAAEINTEDETEEVAAEDETEEVAAEDETEEVTDEAEDEAAADESQPEEQLEAVAASAKRKEVRVNLSGLRQRQRAARPESTPASSIRDVAFAAPNVPGYGAGQSMDFSDMAKAIDRRLSGFNVKSYESARRAGRRQSERFAIANISRTFNDGLVIDGGDQQAADEAMNRAVDQTKLEGGSLVASGGWCAPSETLYDLCDLSESANLISLPEINISRGGVRFTPGPDYDTIFGQTGFCYTEEEDEAGDYDGAGGGVKPCFHVDCPDFVEERLGYCGVCITAGLLQSRGYPEAIENFINIALNAHAHRVSAAVINDLVAQSTAVAFPAGQVGATAPLLTALELQAQHYRAINRMSDTATLEVVLPTWTRSVVRADLSRRLGVDLIAVSDSRIAGWFSELNLNVQYVVDWQDIATTPASGFTATPTQVDFLLYAAGTFVKGVTDSITLENIYDSTMLGTNDYTALFTEDPYLVAKRCHDSRVVSVPVCTDGSTHIGEVIACDGTAGA